MSEWKTHTPEIPMYLAFGKGRKIQGFLLDREEYQQRGKDRYRYRIFLTESATGIMKQEEHLVPAGKVAFLPECHALQDLQMFVGQNQEIALECKGKIKLKGDGNTAWEFEPFLIRDVEDRGKVMRDVLDAPF